MAASGLRPLIIMLRRFALGTSAILPLSVLFGLNMTPTTTAQSAEHESRATFFSSPKSASGHWQSVEPDLLRPWPWRWSAQLLESHQIPKIVRIALPVSGNHYRL